MWHNTSGDWAQIHLKVVVCVDCVHLYWKFKMMLNGMWGAPCSQQGSALRCLIPGAPILQMLHLEMSSHDLIHKNLWPSGANRWVVCVTVLWWFATSCAGHFTFPGSNYKQSTDHAILYVSLFLLTNKVQEPNPLKLWTSCTLQAKGLMVSFSWHLDKCFLTVILCHHQIQPFLSVIFSHKMIKETCRKIHGVDKWSSLMTLLYYNHSFRVQG